MLGQGTETAHRVRLRALFASLDTPVFRLAARLLSNAFEFAYERVESVPRVHDLLQSAEWDILLCDPGLRIRGCQEMLALLRERGEELTVIALVEEDDEKAARDLIGAGIRAVLGPARLGRLVPIVSRELDRTRRNRLRELRALVHSSPDPMLIAGADGRIRRVNRLLEELLGYGANELIDQPVEMLVPEPLRSRHIEDRERYAADPQARPMGAGVELAARHKDGREIPVEISLGPVRYGDEQLICCGLRDVRGRKRSARELQVLLENSPDPMLIAASDGRILRSNRLLEELLGYSESELVGQPVEVLVPESLRLRHVEDRERYAAAPHARPMGIGAELAARHKDGSEIPVEISLGPARIEGEQLICCGLRDLRERRRAERLLRAIFEGTASETGEAFLRALVKNLALALDVRYAFVSEVTGAGREAARVLAFWDGSQFAEPFEYRLAGNPCGIALEESEFLMQSGIQARFPAYHRLAELTAESFFAVRLQVNSGAPLGVLAIVDVKPLAHERITRTVMQIFAARAAAELERMRTTAALGESEHRFKRLTYLAADWYWEQDADLRFTRIEGPEDTPLAGFKQAIGKRRWEMEGWEVSAEQWAEHRGLLDARQPFRDLDLAVRDAQGRRRWVSINGEPVFDAGGTFRGYRGTSREITDRKLAEESLRQSEARFRDLADLSSDWYWEQDENLRFVKVPGAPEWVSPLRASDFVGKTRWELVSADVSSGRWAEHRRALEAHEEFRDFEYTRLSRNGTMRWVSVSGRPVYHEDGRFRGYRGVGRDITARKRADESLRESEQRLRELLTEQRTIFQNALAGIVYARNRRIVRCNRAFADFLGYQPEDLIDKSTRVVYPSDEDYERFAREAADKLPRDGRLSGEKQLVRADGKLIWVAYRVAPLDRADLSKGTVLVAIDVTERKRADEALRESEARIRLLADNVPAMIAYSDREYRFRYANRQFAEFYAGKEIPEGWPMAKALGAATYAAVRSGVERALAGEVVRYDVTRRRHDGALRHIDATLVPHRADDGGVAGVYTFVLDVTESRRAEEELRESAAQLRLLTDNVPAMICYFGTDYRYRYANRSYVEFYTGSESIERQPLAEVLGPDAWAEGKARIDRALAGESVTSRIRRRRRTDGSMRDLEISLVPHRDESGRVQGVYALLLDVTQRRRAEAALRLRNRALESSVNSITITEPTAQGQKIVYVNPAFTTVTGYASDEALGRSPRFLHGEDRDQPGIAALRAAAREERETTVLLRNYRKDGSLFWNELRVAPVRDENGRVTHFVGVANDVSERIRYQEELERQANYDTLTGLANRNLLNDRLTQALIKSDRSQLPVGLIYVDLDNLSRINDSLGHAIGDRVIAAMGQRLAESVRTGDTVARIGGDEFVIVLADLKREEDAGAVAAKVLERIGARLTVDALEFVISASVGIAVYPKDGGDAGTLLRNADAALYRAKEDGRGCYRFFAAEMNERLMQFVTLEQDLRRALEAGELSLQYQPIVGLRTGEVVGAEALIRWRRRDGSMVSPAQFIPVAEECGLIVPIGRWVLDTAARQAAIWNRGRRRSFYVSVNLSARQFRDPELLETVRAALAGAQLAPAHLKLEITETAVMQDAEGAQHRLRELKDLGLGLSVDDFGTGYSSLAYLKRFPIDTLKIDRGFVRGLPGDCDDLAICRAVIDLGRRLEMEVLAEGVETGEQAKLLAAHGCKLAQGYFFGRPVDPDALTASLDGANRAARRSKR